MRLKDDKAPAFKEANRYLLNAGELLRKAGRDNGYFVDKKYVRLAGHAAWTGVLIAVGEYLHEKGVKKGKGRKSNEWYHEELSKLNRTINKAFVIAYEGLHLSLGYDGSLLVKSARAFLDEGKHLIELCKRG